MSTNAWQNRGGRYQNPRTTPQNRSNNASPSHANANHSSLPTAPHQQQQQLETNKHPPTSNNNISSPNVWTQRNANHSTSSNGPSSPQDDHHTPVNSFNPSAIKTFLSRNTAASNTYKPQEAPGGGGGAAAAGRGSGGAWGKPNNMANGQPFFMHLAKQIATSEGGG